MSNPFTLARELRESFMELSCKREMLQTSPSFSRAVVTFRYDEVKPEVTTLKDNIKAYYASSPEEGMAYERKVCLALSLPFKHPNKVFKSLIGPETKLAFEEVDDPYLLVVKGTFFDNNGKIARPKPREVRATQFHQQWKGRFGVRA